MAVPNPASNSSVPNELIKELSEFVASKFPLFRKDIAEKIFAKRFRDALNAPTIQESIGSKYLSETLLDAIYPSFTRLFTIEGEYDVLEEFRFYGTNIEQDFQCDLLRIFRKYYDFVE